MKALTGRRIRVFVPVLLAVLVVLVLASVQAAAQTTESLEIRLNSGEGKLTTPIRIVILMTILTIIPAILVSVTSFTRLVIVMHFIRQALGTQTMPPNQILIGLSLFLTFFIMQPTFDRVNQQALEPLLSGDINEMQALDKASGPMRQFMLKYTREKDLALFTKIAGLPRPNSPNDVSMRVLIPSFMISEMKTAFQIGFVIYIPFLVIDMVVASILLSMGMMQLPPIMISVPFKILLFVMVDGWNLLMGSLVKSFY
jgi:flagellar biosynthetic protein FliP